MQSSTIGPKLLSMIGPITGMEHVGLGTDGGGRLPALISGYKDVRDLVKLIGAMQEIGLSHEEIAAYMGGNLLRVLRQCIG